MEVPMLDLRAQYASIKDEIDAAVAHVFEQHQFRGGPLVEAFESDLAAFANARHAIGVASGTDALYLSLRALALAPGDEVITTPFSFFATAGAIVNAGGIPVFADVEPDTYTMDPACVEALVTPRTRAILPVHLFGQCARMDVLSEIATRHGLALLEDAAQALGARCGGSPVGYWGSAAALSFYPTKNLGGAGEGGAVLTNDDDLAEHIRLLRGHGAAPPYRHLVVGVNSHLHTLQAAVLHVKLKRLAAWNEARRERARYYNFYLGEIPGITLPAETDGAYHVYHQYVVRVPERDAARRYLNEHGIDCNVFYPIPLHQQPCFASFTRGRQGCPEAERACGEVLALPLYPELSREQQDAVIATLGEYMGRLHQE